MALMNKLVATVLFVWFIALGGGGLTALVAADPPLPDCTNTVITLQGCLPFVTGKTSSPTTDCCSYFKNVHYTNPACLCVLAQDDSTTRIIPDYNIHLAGQLPTLCDVPGASISNCPALLGETNVTAPSGGPVATAPKVQEGGAYSLTISGNLRTFVVTYLAIVLASTSLIGYSRC